MPMAENDTHATLLARWLTGDLSPSELAELESDPDFAALKRAAEEAAQLSPPPFDAEASWEALAAEAGLQEQVVQEPVAAPPATETTVLRPHFFRQHGWKVMAAAAALILLVLFVTQGSGPAMTRVSAAPGQLAKATLPDSSTVHLNAGSAIEYAEANWATDRQVSLEGEAFFEVKKGSRFEVNTDLGTVAVLGTSFNVRARAAMLQVACYTGKVQVSDATGSEIGLLTAGQGLQHSKGTTERLESPADSGPQWRAGTLRFAAMPFFEVIAELERQFAITVTYPEEMKKRSFTGVFQRNDLDAALDAVRIPFGLQAKADQGKQKFSLY